MTTLTDRPLIPHRCADCGRVWYVLARVGEQPPAAGFAIDDQCASCRAAERSTERSTEC